VQVLAGAGAAHKESTTVDQIRFEGLAKEVAGSRSRRQVLRALAVGSGLGAMALLGLKGEAQAFNPCDGTGSKPQFCEQCCGAVNTGGDVGRCVRKCRELARNP